MSNRVFLLSKNNTTIGVAYNQNANTASKLKFVSDKATADGKNNYQLTSIDSINTLLEKLDVSTFDNVCQIYVPSVIEEAIKAETYKFWLLTGKNSKDETVDPALMEVWQRFSDLMSQKGQYFVFRSIKTCYLKDYQLNNPKILAKIDLFRRANDTYARYCKAEIDKLFPVTEEGTIPVVL